MKTTEVWDILLKCFMCLKRLEHSFVRDSTVFYDVSLKVSLVNCSVGETRWGFHTMGCNRPHLFTFNKRNLLRGLIFLTPRT